MATWRPPAFDKFRPYQRAAIGLIADAERRVLYQLATGGGKTYVACGVIQETPGRVLVLAHRRELRTQMQDTMEVFGIDPKRVVLADPSVAKRWSDAELATFSLVIVDESHRAGGDVYSALLARMPEAKILGITATPTRQGGLAGEFDQMIPGPTMAQLVEDKFLVPAKCWSVPADRAPDLKGVRTRGGEYEIGAAAKAMNKPHLVGDIPREWLEHANGVSTLVFATDVKHGQAITTAFQEAGVDARFVHGGTPEKARKALVASFKAGDFPVLVNAMLFVEGIDVPRIGCVVIARPAKSIVIFLQMIGRGTRIWEGKKSLLVLDHAGAWRNHGSPMADREWSLDAPEEDAEKGAGGTARSKQCAACGFENAISAGCCAECGATFRVVDTETKLEEVKEYTCLDCGVRIGPPREGKPYSNRCVKHAGKFMMASWSPERRAEMAKKRDAAMTPEQRSNRVKKGQATLTPEQRSARSKKANASRTAEQRTLSAKTWMAGVPATDLSVRARKAWETRRVKAEQPQKDAE